MMISHSRDKISKLYCLNNSHGISQYEVSNTLNLVIKKLHRYHYDKCSNYKKILMYPLMETISPATFPCARFSTLKNTFRTCYKHQSAREQNVCSIYEDLKYKSFQKIYVRTIFFIPKKLLK